MYSNMAMMLCNKFFMIIKIEYDSLFYLIRLFIILICCQFLSGTGYKIRNCLHVYSLYQGSCLFVQVIVIICNQVVPDEDR